MAYGTKFCTAINCMDGRVQLPVINYLKKRFNAGYVDCITDKGPNLILSEQTDGGTVQSILGKLKISIENHKSVGMAIAGHYDCAGNPAPKEQQIAHIKDSVKFLKNRYPDMEIIGLWVDENWKVEEVI